MDRDILLILETLVIQNGIEIRRVDLRPPLNGFYWDPLTIPPAIFLSNGLYGKELNYVFAHELGHSQLMDEDDGDLIRCKDRAKVLRAETQADNFANMLIDGIKLALSAR